MHSSENLQNLTMLGLHRWPTLGDRGSIKVRAEADQLVLSERPRLRYLVTFFLVALFATPIVVGGIAGLFANQPQHLICDRARDTCERDGVTLAPLHDIAGAELTEREVRGTRTALGYFQSVTFVLRDGTHLRASSMEAQSTSSTAEYRAAVDAIRKFLANPSQSRLETTFEYRPSWSERIYLAATSAMPLCFLVAMLSLWPGSSYVCGQGLVIAKNGPRFGKKLTYELPIDQIAVIGDRRSEIARGIDLQLIDGNRILIAHSRHGRIPDSLLPNLQKVLEKPIEQH